MKDPKEKKVVHIHKDLHERLKVYCEKNGLKLNRFVEIIIEDKLKENENN